ncbi:AraC family transcriptional regulator [Jiangella mangrovi]|uniref:AraC-like DNA-binding protein/mannose-6-phosphate isomerase-like protein (Cupin superfamily) n=1 Tax=Jiangella mangrovi TaxID=1524084 RepID=A0A7W9GWV1_9ACTN|nr:AraC family transcriptional regulator [Jiangella mangrovi]MBB5791251.1 AraC-like DNA-binding protein/mannose-6-phosphate isomerase-like protein (cupin superfamily) [Jiangella mangrovi]
MPDGVTRFRFQEHALGQPCHVARVTIRGVSESHLHLDYYEVMAVFGGAGEQRLRSERQALAPGDVVLVRPGDQHAVVGDPLTGVEFFNVAFSAQSWRTFADLAQLAEPRRWDDAPRPPLVRPEPAGHEAVLRACETLARRFPTGTTMLDLVRFWTALTEVVCPEAPAVPAGPSPSTPSWLSAACAAMRREENLRDGVPRLLELACVSPAHLSRSMRRHYGVTPTEYVTALRLQHAAGLLATTTGTVTGIAFRCGFLSQSYFIRCFGRLYGSSPQRFRLELQRKYVP